MLDRPYVDLPKLAADLESHPFDPAATVSYDLFAGAIIWSDEYILTECKLRLMCDHDWDSSCMRPVFRHRTELILGIEEHQYETYWQAARELFPRWIGFTPERCARNRKLEAFYYQSEKTAMDAFEKFASSTPFRRPKP